MSGGTSETDEISMTTRELLAAIMLFTEKTVFPERELMAHVANIRLKSRGRHLSSNARVTICLSGFLAAEVLQYEKVSDVFRFDPRNAGYLRSILENARIFPELEGAVRKLIADTAPLGETPAHRESQEPFAQSAQ